MHGSIYQKFLKTSLKLDTDGKSTRKKYLHCSMLELLNNSIVKSRECSTLLGNAQTSNS